MTDRRVTALLDILGDWADLSDDEVVARLRQRGATPAEVEDLLEVLRSGE